MTIISSHRAHSDSKEVARNQIRANRSWQKIATRIVYLGNEEPHLSGHNVRFLPCADFPRIRTVATAAAISGTHACIVNADIVLSKETPIVIFDLLRRGGKAAVSRRYEFQDEHVEGAVLLPEDLGLDFFFATADLWLKLSRTIPPDYRIGHSSWDTYTLSFFNTIAKGGFYDITNRRCVFHPRHGDRKRKYNINPVDDKFTMKPQMPRAKL